MGSGKTRLIEQIVPVLSRRGYRCCIISNDVVSKEEAERMQRTLSTEARLMPEDMIIGIATGGCPHTAVREDPSINLAVIDEIEHKDPTLDLIIIESGGDNTMTTFSPALADYFIYIVDVAGGDKYPRKRGLGIESCDLLVINKIDLAPYVGANLGMMKRDAALVRPHLGLLVFYRSQEPAENDRKHRKHYGHAEKDHHLPGGCYRAADGLSRGGCCLKKHQEK